MRPRRGAPGLGDLDADAFMRDTLATVDRQRARLTEAMIPSAGGWTLAQQLTRLVRFARDGAASGVSAGDALDHANSVVHALLGSATQPYAGHAHDLPGTAGRVVRAACARLAFLTGDAAPPVRAIWLADLAGVTPGRVFQLMAAGVLARADERGFVTVASARLWLAGLGVAGFAPAPTVEPASAVPPDAP